MQSVELFNFFNFWTSHYVAKREDNFCFFFCLPVTGTFFFRRTLQVRTDFQMTLVKIDRAEFLQTKCPA